MTALTTIQLPQYNLEDDCIELEREQNEELIYETHSMYINIRLKIMMSYMVIRIIVPWIVLDRMGMMNTEQYEIDELVEDFSGSENDNEVLESCPDTDTEGLLLFLLDLVNTDKYDSVVERILDRDNRDKLSRNGSLGIADREALRKAIALEIVKLQLKEFTRLQRTTVDVGALSTQSYYNFNLRSNSLIVEHDPSLDNYWEELFNTFLHVKEGTVRKYQIREINIAKVGLMKEVMDKFANYIRGKDLRSVQLDDTNLSPEAIVSLSNLLVNNRNVYTLQIRHNKMDDIHAGMHLSRALKAHKRIEHLDLSNCSLGDNAEVLHIILQSNIKKMNLSNNNIGSPGAAKIAEYLETNTGMFQLVLDGNSFTDTDAVLFAKSLKKNTKLQRLQIRQNSFTVTGVKSLIKGVFDTSSLNAMSDCNHVCALHILSEPAGVRRERLNISGLNWELDRMSKLLSLFFRAKESSMMHYLEDVPVEYMPEVLSFIQNEKDQLRQADTMYTIVRYWEMPTLYSFHSGALPRCNGSAGKRKRDCIE